MNRRTFLHLALATGAVGARAADVPRRVRIGFLGVAHSHGPAKLKIAQTGADWELVGLAEEDESIRARHQKDGVPIRTVGQLLESSEVIAVESPNADHFRHAKAALEAGLHVHIEKPPGTTLDEFAELVRLARDRNRLLQPGYMWRHHPGFARIFEAVQNGWLGKVSLVRATMNSSYTDADARRELASLPGGGMMELGCHVIDQVVRLLGAPSAVTTTHRTHGAADKLTDNSLAVFDYPHALAMVHINLLQPGAGAHRTFEVIGSNGTATMRPIEQPMLELDLASAAGPYKKGRQILPLPKYERYRPEFAELANAIRTERPLGISLDQELLVHEWVMKACR